MKFVIGFFLFIFLFVVFVWFAIARPFTFSSTGEPHDIDTVVLKENVRRISQDFFPRNSDNPQLLNQLSAYIHKQFSVYSSRVSYQEFDVSGQTYRNVIAKFGPENTPVIVVGAHYDSFAELPGADDNASGVVGLLELGRLVSRLDLNYQLQLVAYTLEEPPFFSTQYMGSYVHASQLKDANTNVKLMISLEMIGYFSNVKGSQHYPVSALKAFYPTEGDFIAVIDQLNSNDALPLKSVFNSSTNIEAYSLNVPASIEGVDFSDHRNYWAFDYPAVMVTDTSFYRNQSYHTQYDTYDTLNYDKMAEVISGVFLYIKALNDN